MADKTENNILIYNSLKKIDTETIVKQTDK